jgi:hypothetical protein
VNQSADLIDVEATKCQQRNDQDWQHRGGSVDCSKDAGGRVGNGHGHVGGCHTAQGEEEIGGELAHKTLSWQVIKI